ncbi:diacylglycerol kinase family protein [Oceanobacillus kapialis]|uniref:Diacylglycerol kinase family protein n=1 Tax=Oceanobacillus kapialis TaxID=481353 RepID=A0ABW5Q5R5_9BACI
MKDKRRSIGFKFALNGIWSVMKSERNFRLHLLAAIIVIIAGFVVELSRIEWLFTVVAIGSVLSAESLNSAVEKMLDYLNPDVHPQAKIVKDVAAGAVLLTAVMATIIGVIVFLPNIVSMLKSW